MFTKANFILCIFYHKKKELKKTPQVFNLYLVAVEVGDSHICPTSSPDDWLTPVLALRVPHLRHPLHPGKLDSRSPCQQSPDCCVFLCSKSNIDLHGKTQSGQADKICPLLKKEMSLCEALCTLRSKVKMHLDTL